jgi:hypothetical protein
VTSIAKFYKVKLKGSEVHVSQHILIIDKFNLYHGGFYNIVGHPCVLHMFHLYLSKDVFTKMFCHQRLKGVAGFKMLVGNMRSAYQEELFCVIATPISVG